MANEVSTLSTDINVITAEINAYQRVAGEAIFEIGNRLKGVRDNPQTYGFEGYRDWENWCEASLNIKRGQANRFIKVYERFKVESPGIQVSQNITVAYLLTSFDDEELTEPREMPVRELREVKAELKRKDDQITELEAQAKQATEKAEKAESARQIAEEIFFFKELSLTRTF